MKELALATNDPGSGERPELHVVFRVADAEFALPAAAVHQLESYTGATRVPGSPPFVAGIMQIRGRVVPVVDARARFGLPAREPTLDTRVVVGAIGDRLVALLVDHAREVLAIAPSQVSPPHALLGDGANGFIRAVANVGPRVVMLLDFERMVGQEPEYGDG
jgi:purine-binding chemotaxis protein CheW